MPGGSHAGPLPPLTGEEERTRVSLARWVDGLAGEIGPRSTDLPEALISGLVYLEGELERMGLASERHSYAAGSMRVTNLVAELPGADSEAGIFVIGAHYDAFPGSSGANDNASGVAALLALAERAAGRTPEVTLRFVLFTNEEPPHFQTESMGSLVYAEECAERGDDIVGMWSLETLAYYDTGEGTQSYPVPMLRLAYPTRGDFVAFVGDLGSRALVRETVGAFRRSTEFPSEGAALPGCIAGVGWSDHWSFARVGYPALMVTDTALFRDPLYHTAGDRPERLDLSGLARVVVGLGRVLEARVGLRGE